MKDIKDIPSSQFAQALELVAKRAASAVVAQGRLRSSSARSALLRRLSSPAGTGESFLADPVFEAARVWARADMTLGQMVGKGLREDLVSALDEAPTRRWPRDATIETPLVAPYLHQKKAWDSAAAGRNFMVTSGTGSGKTECFMVPMLNDLLEQSKDHAVRGVQAIVLYPLNALIESQKERLGEWMGPFKGRLSYALYNRHMEQELPRHKWPSGSQVPDRKRLRDNPSSVLVTNTTMLEYLLMRAEDRPILEQSQGKLRWIILDEAHSYVGAQAAEMALLLRRVRQGFGVRPEDVRIVATSATIGEGAETIAALRQFVADLGGIDPSQVDIIEGTEVEPMLPAIGQNAVFSQLEGDAQSLWPQLGPDARMRRVRSQMRSGGLSLSVAASVLGFDPTSDYGRAQTFSVLEAGARAVDPRTQLQFAPWRLHAFHRAQGGLFACVDAVCPHRDPELLEADSDWHFGQIWTEHRETCSCGAPVFEIFACGECGTPWLKAGMRWVGPSEFLVPLTDERDDDEYRLDREPDDDEITVIDGNWVLIGPAAGGRYLRVSDGEVLSAPASEAKCIAFSLLDKPEERGCCDRAHLASLSPQRFGAPFLMGNAMPALLQSLPINREAPNGPSQGRRLLSFTDSRQGTARFSAKLQQDAERTLTRAVIYHAVQEASAGSPENAETLREQVAALEATVAAVPVLQTQLDAARVELKKAEGGAAALKWSEMISRLAQNHELISFAGDVWRARPNGGDKLAEDPILLAELFLMREMFRRPRMQNNAETMGLARLIFPAIEERARLHVPDALKEASHGADVWSDLIHAAIDLVFRNNLAVEMSAFPVDMRHWISPKSVIGSVLEPQTPVDYVVEHKSIRRFPSARSSAALVSLVYKITGGSAESDVDLERASSVLNAIWTALVSTKTIKSSNPNAYRLDLTRSQIAGLEQAWVCPVTGRLLPYAPAGFSLTALEHVAKATQVPLPKLPIAHATGVAEVERKQLRAWLETDPSIAKLRKQGLWSNLQDRISEFAPFLRSQEHSAQIDRASLQIYEEAFKAGKINILNCSTTMEMGVDIPDVGMVVNTNVPPAPSNYRQRVGRAGRRGEPWAMAFTFCKDVPLDRAVFRDPASILQAQVQAPKVRMDSSTLVQRHVNSLVLGIFLRDGGGVKIKTSIGSFFGATEISKTPVLAGNIAENFKIALQGEWAQSARLDEALGHLVRGTVLDGVSGLGLRTLSMFERMQDRWMQEYEQLLQAQEAVPETDAVHRFYKVRAKRMREEFMMTELARRGFTPAYGFPVDVVSFDHVGVDQMSGGPSRPLEVAIRDYSPGTETVIDGLVHRSDGIRPSWGNRNDPSAVEDLRSLWTCKSCNSFGTARILPVECPNCGDIPKFDEILRPAGFLGTKKPHSAYERLDYVPPDPSRVTAEGGQWVSLVNPDLGRFRVDRAGRLLTTASGTNGFGYAICIACGRASAETDESNTKLPEGMKGHFPLQPIKGDVRAAGQCPANDEGSRQIRRRVKLGAETETDVYELQLDCLAATKPANAMALALIAALREALSERLGVDAEEMGTTVAPSLRADGSKRISLFLYDKATGGSGFAVAAEANLPAMLVRSEAILDCPNACRHGCPDCILRRDVQFDLTKFDRAGALELLRQQILPHMALPASLQVFGPETRAVTEALPHALLRRLDAGEIKSLTIALPAETQGWDLNDWAGLSVLTKAAREGCQTRIAISEQAILSMSMSQKLDLVRVLARSQATVHSYKTLPELTSATVLMELETDSGVLQVATPDVEAAHVSTGWGQVLVAPILLGQGEAIAISQSISQDKLAAFGEGNAISFPIVAQLDGRVIDFGKKFWTLVRKLRPQAFAGNRVLTKIRYQDRYLRSPLTARLLFEVWKATPNRTEKTNSLVVSEWIFGETRDCFEVIHNWSEDTTRSEVIAGLLNGATVDLMRKADCPHARQLLLEFDDGQELRITLDQGFGAWRITDRGKRFDFRAENARQVSDLRNAIFSVEIQERGRHPSPIVIEW